MNHPHRNRLSFSILCLVVILNVSQIAVFKWRKMKFFDIYLHSSRRGVYDRVDRDYRVFQVSGIHYQMHYTRQVIVHATQSAHRMNSYYISRGVFFKRL